MFSEGVIPGACWDLGLFPVIYVNSLSLITPILRLGVAPDHAPITLASKQLVYKHGKKALPGLGTVAVVSICNCVMAALPDGC